MSTGSEEVRRVEPLADAHRWFEFKQGRFDSGQRTGAALVEGVIRSSRDILMVTLSGSARRLEVQSDCGHRFAGRERAGAVSFVPAGCERRLVLRDVSSRWGSIEVEPSVAAEIWPEQEAVPPSRSFTNAIHPMLASIVAEFDRLHCAFGAIDAAYCETMVLATIQYLAWRGRGESPHGGAPHRLTPSQLRRVRELIEARLDCSLSVSDLARAAGVSTGHFHRAFRATTGMTPLRYLQAERVERAATLLATGSENVTDISLQVGFASPGHFAQVFTRTTGLNPSAYRRAHRG